IDVTFTTFCLDPTPFIVQCMEFVRKHKSPTPPVLPMLSDISQCSAHCPSTYAVSDFERTSYYNGITTEGKPPELLYCTGSAKYLWIEPSSKLPTKSLCGVHCTLLNDVWSTVSHQVSQLVREQTNHYSIDPVCFVTMPYES
ncbi:hypothetical protein EDD15DRAFT_2162096, partial [Pisolithus albus]